jgi:DNA polymerase-3 subunit beta
MAQQDVRYYLNGMLFDLNNDEICVVTTDGHRLALSESSIHSEMEELKQLIIPRKTVVELQKILNDNDENINIDIDENHIQFRIGNIILTSKLIDGKFPDYSRVIPTNNDKIAKINRNRLRQALIRSAIISNEKFKGARFNFSTNLLIIETQNAERENSKEEIPIEYNSSELSIGFNISYILDILNICHEEYVELKLRSTETSCLIQLNDDNGIKSIYVVMPMRI